MKHQAACRVCPNSQPSPTVPTRPPTTQSPDLADWCSRLHFLSADLKATTCSLTRPDRHLCLSRYPRPSLSAPAPPHREFAVVQVQVLDQRHQVVQVLGLLLWVWVGAGWVHVWVWVWVGAGARVEDGWAGGVAAWGYHTPLCAGGGPPRLLSSRTLYSWRILSALSSTDL